MSLNSLIMMAVRASNRRERAIRSQLKVDQFNEKWKRLNQIRGLVLEHFVHPLDGYIDVMTEKENEKRIENLKQMDTWMQIISSDINNVPFSELSKYATRIKRSALHATKLCQKYKAMDDISSVEYVSYRKMIVINEQDFFYFG